MAASLTDVTQVGNVAERAKVGELILTHDRERVIFQPNRTRSRTRNGRNVLGKAMAAGPPRAETVCAEHSRVLLDASAGYSTVSFRRHPASGSPCGGGRGSNVYSW
jgi:hypothetical protein